MDLDSPDIQARLAALADGTLDDPPERERLLSEIERSPELQEAVERQRQAVAMLASLGDAKASPTLHEAIDSMASSAPRRASRVPRPRLRIAFAGGLAAAVAVVLAIVLSNGGAARPTLLQAAGLALRPVAMPAPGQSSSGADQLARSVDGVAYPYWQDSLGWRASGMRTDRLDGRSVTTVFYTAEQTAHGGPGSVGYAIVSGRALPVSSIGDGQSITAKGIRFFLTSHGGARVLTWRRDDHTCILVSRRVRESTLIRLASWD